MLRYSPFAAGTHHVLAQMPGSKCSTERLSSVLEARRRTFASRDQFDEFVLTVSGSVAMPTATS